MLAAWSKSVSAGELWLAGMIRYLIRSRVIAGKRLRTLGMNSV